MSLFSRVRRVLYSRYWRLKHRPLEEMPHAPDLFHAYRAFTQDSRLKRRPGGWEYKGRFYGDYLTVGGASQAIVRTAKKYCHGQGLDIGAGLWPLPGATPVDIWRGPGASRHLDEIADGTQDYVFSSHCLEHVVEWRAELRRWVGKLKPGGTLFLYLPHPECGIWEPGSPMVWDEHKWQPEPEIVRTALTSLGCTIVASDDGPDAMMSFFIAARRN